MSNRRILFHLLFIRSPIRRLIRLSACPIR